MTTTKQQDQEEARARLKEILKPGDTVWTILRYVNRDGTRRAIDLVAVIDGKAGAGHGAYHEARSIGPKVAQLIGQRFDYGRDGIIVSGGGMDLGWELVDDLGRALGYIDKDKRSTLRQRWL